jgi:hypothetical protein
MLVRWARPVPTQLYQHDTSDSGVSLSLTKALVEANRAIPHQNRRAFGHADRSGVFARDGESLKSAQPKPLRESVAA